MANHLNHLTEFRQLLENYQISEQAKQMLLQTPLVLLVGPTSSGRNTLIDALLQTGEYYHIVSDTTRELRLKDGRPIEQNGREYWFRSEADMLAGLRSGEYMEAAVIHNQQVCGCNIREIEAAHQAQKIAIKDIEPGGAHTIYSLKPESTIIFVLPPSFNEWLRRLESRGTLPADELQRRLASARQELASSLSSDYYQFVINTTTPQAIAEIQTIIKTGHQKPILQTAARQLAQQLQQTLEQRLVQRG